MATPTRHTRRKKDDGALATVLPSGALARILAHFVLHPATPVHFRQLQRITGLPHRSLQVELLRLQRFGILSREEKGRTVQYRIQAAHPRWKALRNLVREFAEPGDLLKPALTRRPGVAAAFIYGSFARPTDVHAGSDVDVLVITETGADQSLLTALADEVLQVGGLLGREVNLTRYAREDLAAARGSDAAKVRRGPRRSRFLSEILAGPKRWLIGDESRLQALLTEPSTA